MLNLSLPFVDQFNETYEANPIIHWY